ncbi:isochorismatase family cysteine hydrolase [Flavivirga abyssicola]|uniref:cysteine hydrolase family protein n=1 Tax=Flavivirga abyssicola TaxID=3063533 RepID=UPI0026DF805C|nr:isochorismatase family cysteine hydrolase [Flavivirga sp. MEBiC07777]WVK12475.1 isochorismatase family cysteine hydrolase [Flavivirga sp. MEBiC07777]
MKFTFDKTKAALVVVDMQKLFTLPSSPYGNDASEMIAPINELMQLSRETDIPVIHSAYTLKKDGSQNGLRTDWPQIEEGYFDPNSDWAQWDERLEQKDEDYILTRTRPSVFFDGQLTQILKKLGKEQVILLGLSTNYSISFSVHEGFSRDIPIFLVDDLSNMTAFEDRSQKSFLHNTLDMWACQLISSKDIGKTIVNENTLLEDFS